jgi:hypothetical protein
LQLAWPFNGQNWLYWLGDATSTIDKYISGLYFRSVALAYTPVEEASSTC